jgi:hypothetical protein
VLRTLPYHASRYGKPRIERSDGDHPNREGRAMLACMRATWHEHRCIGPPIGRAVLAVQALRAHLARQESIVYRHVHGAALGASPWLTHLIVWNYSTALHLFIVLHPLPLHL